MDKEEFLGKLQLCYFGDKNAFEEVVCVYDDLQQRIDKSVKLIEEKLKVLYHLADRTPYENLLNILKGDDTNE